jgi:site-specific recombinase XerD
LGLRKSADERQTTVLARHDSAAGHSSQLVAAGITKHIGWHTFRHTFSTLLKTSGVDIKVMQELLRHANSRITLDIYTQAMSSENVGPTRV